MMPAVSVIIPTYRRDESLCRTLEMLLAQDWPNFELIVVDQLPQHKEETERYLERIRDRILYITSPTPNLPAARNTGIRASSGPIVVFFDDDIQVPASTLTQLVNSYNDPKVDGVSGFVVFDTSPEGVVRSVSFEEHYRRHRNRARLIPVHDFLGGFMSFRRNVFAQVGFFDEWVGSQPTARGEDFEFCRRLHVAGRRLFLNPAISVIHEPALAGGCDTTLVALDERRFLTLKIRFYAYLKNRRRDGLRGFAPVIYRCYRSHILNRSILTLDPRFHYRQHQQFFRAMRFALHAARGRNAFRPPPQ
jgi:glycosyltransferase involved in cell wall biosynthesis